MAQTKANVNNMQKASGPLGESSTVQRVYFGGNDGSALKQRQGFYALGDAEVFVRGVRVAIVGTRAPSGGALLWLKSVVNQIAVLKDEVITVSGYANGIDKAIFNWSVNRGIRTIAFLPNLDTSVIKYRENALFVSRYINLSGIKHWHFVERNRYIAGVSKALLVVQAPLSSGALITADFARNMGLPVFFRPPRFSYKDIGGLIYLSRFYGESRVALSLLDILYEVSPRLYLKLLRDIAIRFMSVVPKLKQRVKIEKFTEKLTKHAFNLIPVFRYFKLSEKEINQLVIELVKKNVIIVNRKVAWLNSLKLYE